MEMRKVNIDGINIAYARRGQGAPLVLVHGYPLDHSIWDPLAPFLEHDFDLIIPDLRGFGQSAATPAAGTLSDYASDIAKLLYQLKISKAYIAGHSMGGYISLAFVREHPEHVSGLAMIASQMVADTPERKEGRRATAKQVLESGVGSVADSIAPKLSSEKQWQEFAHALTLQQPAAGIAAALNAMADRPDSSALVASVRFPVVIVHGDADQLIPVERAQEMKAALPAARYVELSGAGHLLMMERPERVAEALMFFQTAQAS